MIPQWRYCKQCGAERLTCGPGDRCDQCSQWPDDIGWRSAADIDEEENTQ